MQEFVTSSTFLYVMIATFLATWVLPILGVVLVQATTTKEESSFLPSVWTSVWALVGAILLILGALAWPTLIVEGIMFLFYRL
jgi:hypothetical protein